MDFDILVDAIYEAGADPQRWESVLALLATAFNGVCGAMHVGDARNEFNFGAAYNLDPEAADAYANHFFAINPLNAPLTRVAAGIAIGDQQLVPREEYHDSEFHNAYGMRYGLNGSVTAIIDNLSGQVSCLGVVTATGADPYSIDEINTFQRLVPHIRRAVDLNRKLAALRGRAETAERELDRLEFGLIYLGARGEIVRCNSAGAALLASANGLRIIGKHVYAIDRTAQGRLSYLIDAAVEGNGPRGGSLHIPRPDGKKPLFARVYSYRGSSLTPDTEVRAVVYLQDPERAVLDGINQVANAYGLTSAEARVLAALIEDNNIRGIAQEFGVSHITVRNQLSRILQKTGTSKQAELIRLVAGAHIPTKA